MLNFSDASSYGMVSQTFRLIYLPANDVFSVVLTCLKINNNNNNKKKNVCLQLLYLIRSVKFYNGTTHIFNRIVVVGYLPLIYFCILQLKSFDPYRRTNTLSFSAILPFSACLPFCKGRRERESKTVVIDNDHSLREKMPFSAPGSRAEIGVCSGRLEEKEGCRFLFLVLQIEILNI